MSKFMALLEDKDAFIVKLPHKFKEYLTDQETFTLSKRDLILGKIVLLCKQPVRNPENGGPVRPTIEELLESDKNEGRPELLMHLEMPR
jgi:hypothetical protein